MLCEIPASPVRTLANRYAMGELEYRAYILERRRLIDAIVAGELALPTAIEEMPPTSSPTSTPIALEVGDTVFDAEATIELPRAAVPTRRWWQMFVVVGGVLGLSGLWSSLAAMK